MALSKVDLANQVENQLPQNLVANNLPFRNIIINGDMSIAQRGTSFTGLGNGDSAYTLDRWRFAESGSPTFEFTLSQDTDVPSGQGFATSLKMDCTTAQGSLGASDNLRIATRLEGQNLQYLKKGTSNAESLTASFWVKSNKTGTYILELNDRDNTRSISKSYTINSASTWEKKTITFAGDTSGVLDNDNAESLRVAFYLNAGTDYTSGTLQTSWGSRTNANIAVGQVNLADDTANEWLVTGVQLEAGTSASDFEFLPFDTQLQRCLRYYEKFVDYSVVPAEDANSPTADGANGWIAYNSGNIRTPPISFKCEKRASPSITIYRGNNPTAGNMGWYNGSSWQDAGSNIPKITAKGFYGSYNSTAAFTQFNAYLMDFSWTADSEL